jgi:Resolvase, N terminal domain/Helix-turn-helix domain of resolvase
VPRLLANLGDELRGAKCSARSRAPRGYGGPRWRLLLLIVQRTSTGPGGAAFPFVSLGSTEQPIDTSTAAGKAFLDMLGVFAEFETNLRKERQLEGIAKAKAAGVYKGRRPTVDVLRVRALRQEGIGPSAIAKTLGIGRASVYRALDEQPSEGVNP